MIAALTLAAAIILTLGPILGPTPGRDAARVGSPAVAPQSPAAALGTAIEGGTASHYGSSCLEGCLALPIGPGHRVRVCGAGGCITRVSNDAGPSLAMQRQGRIVDLARNDFERVCGLPWTAGLCRVTVEYLDDGPVPTPPATDTDA